MARVLKGSHSFTCTPRVYPLTEWTIPAFAFPAEAGTYLPTPEGWQAELALGGWLVTYRKISVQQPGHDRPSQYYVCLWLCTASVRNTTQHRTVLIISPLTSRQAS